MQQYLSKLTKMDILLTVWTLHLSYFASNKFRICVFNNRCFKLFLSGVLWSSHGATIIGRKMSLRLYIALQNSGFLYLVTKVSFTIYFVILASYNLLLYLLVVISHRLFVPLLHCEHISRPVKMNEQRRVVLTRRYLPEYLAISFIHSTVCLRTGPHPIPLCTPLSAV